MDIAKEFLNSIADDRTFSENWHPIAQIKTLYVPVNTSSPTDDPIFDLLDISSRELYPEFRVFDVFLSSEPPSKRFRMRAYPALELLSRLLKNDSLSGVTFHSRSKNKESSYTLYRFAVARLVGFLEFCDRQELDLTGCSDLLAADKLCLCLHIAAEAREKNLEFESFFPIEIAALLGMGLYDHSLNYLRWANGFGAKDLVTYQAHLLSITGEPNRALEILRREESQTWQSRLELARALLFAAKPLAATSHFDICLKDCPQHFDALLGKGVSLRASAWESPHKDNLVEALKCFSDVISLDGYHKAEAYHHRGTIYMALEDYTAAEENFRQAIKITPAPVSKRNLCLVLHAQRQFEEAYELFSYLYRFYPEHTDGLEKYFHKRPRLIVFAGQPVVYTGEIDEQIVSMREELKAHGIILKGDLLDFKRVDSFINFYAPAGGLIETAKLTRLSNSEIAEVFGQVSRCLTHTLVSSGQAHWASSPHSPPEQLHIAVENLEGQPQLMCMFHCLLDRLQQGAETSTMLTLESLISHAPNFIELLNDYRDPFPALPAEEDRVSLFESRADQAFALLEQYGFCLNNNLEDLKTLDEVIDALFSDHTNISKAYSKGVFSREEFVTLGLYLGALCRRYASATWYDHPDGFGISLQEMPLETIYPIWRLFKRVESGMGGDGLNNIAGLAPSLVCAELIHLVQEENILSIKSISQLVQEKLPLVTKAAAEQLAQTILLHSSEGRRE